MQVFDLTQLRTVTSPPVTFAETAHYAGFGSTHTLAMNTPPGFAYAVGTRTCEGGLHVVDVRTPAAPRAAGCFSFDGYTHETQCVIYTGPDTVYRDREICFNSNEDTLTMVDATDKLEQVQLSRTGYGGSAYTHQGWLTEDQRFFLVNDEGDELAVQAPDANVDLGRVGPRRPRAGQTCTTARPRRSITTSISAGISSTSRTIAAACACSTRAMSPQGALREVGFFDIYPVDDAPDYNGAWTCIRSSRAGR